MTDWKQQKEEVAFYMQMLFEAYKDGDENAYEELLNVNRIYASYFDNSNSDPVCFLRKNQKRHYISKKK